jgi:hypothetical protein
MKYLAIVAALATIAAAQPAAAELAPMECASVSGTLQQALSLMNSVRGNLIKVGEPMPGVVRTAGTTPTGDAAYDFETKRAALVESIKSFTESGENFAAELQKCAAGKVAVR